MTSTQRNGIVIGPPSRKHLRHFPREVANRLREVSSLDGVRHRVIDGSHILLMVDGMEGAPHGDTLKVAASRKGQDTVKFIDRLMRENGIQ